MWIIEEMFIGCHPSIEELARPIFNEYEKLKKEHDFKVENGLLDDTEISTRIKRIASIRLDDKFDDDRYELADKLYKILFGCVFNSTYMENIIMGRVGFYRTVSSIPGFKQRIKIGIESLREGIFLSYAQIIKDVQLTVVKSPTSKKIRLTNVHGYPEVWAIERFTNVLLDNNRRYFEFDSKLESVAFVKKVEKIQEEYRRLILKEGY